MKFTQFLTQMFTSNSGLSSKRVSGFLGWMVCLCICVYCTLLGIQAPEIVEMLFVCTTSLLGIDCVTKIWRKNINKNDNNGDTGQ